MLRDKQVPSLANRQIQSKWSIRYLMLLVLLSTQRGQTRAFVSKVATVSKLHRYTQTGLRFRCGDNGMMTAPYLCSHRRSFLTATAASASPTAVLQSTASSDSSAICSSQEVYQGGTTKVLADDNQFVKPDPDRREYRWIQLDNNLQVLLVGTTKSIPKSNGEQFGVHEVSHVEAAAVHVQAGHFDDTIPGLAHFNEHMLFLGTEKYPEENDYENFLQKYGGFSNAYTDMEDTNFYFSLSTTTGGKGDASEGEGFETSEALEGSLDRLAQFFISPKFETGMVDREVKAIDSEWRNSRTSDAWRNYQHLKAAANQDHPFANFGCGNLETLTKSNTTSPRPALLEFWKTYYQTYNLRLVVVGYASVDALQASVERTFGALPHSEGHHRRVPHEPFHSEGHHRRVPHEPFHDQTFSHEGAFYEPGIKAFGPDQLGQYRQLIPVMESRSLKLYFASPPVEDPTFRKTRPHRVISHLLGHESPNSLHSLLNDLGYIQSLSSGMGISTTDFSLFTLSLSLTPKGMANKEQVLDLAFQWIALITKSALDPDNLPLMQQYHNELQKIFLNAFKFRENADPTDFCSAMAELMFHTSIPPERILIGNNDRGWYSPEITKAFLDRLKPSNCMIVESSSDLAKEEVKEENFDAGWQREPWYGAQFRVKSLLEDQMQKWENPESIDPRLRLPQLNQYIPTDFSLRCDDLMRESSESTNNKAVNVLEAERIEPPKMIMKRPGLRLWHKMDKYWRVPKAFISFSLVSPVPYKTPRTMTYNRIYQRILNDDLKSTVYDASIAGCSYSVSCTPTGVRFSVRGYNEKLLNLLNQLTARMLTLIEELRQGPNAYPALHEKFEKAKESLCRETKNYRLDSPYEVASYNSRLVLEERVWYLDDYVREMEGEYAELDPLTMEECAQVAEEALTGRHKVEALCMGNINETEARQACQVVEDHLFTRKQSRPLMEAEIPTFRSMQLPTREEAKHIFGQDVMANGNQSVPVVYQELAFSPSEENNAIEYIIQTGTEAELEYEGVALLELFAYISYNSAYNQLRTIEQLGYIVSTFTRKTSGGGLGFSVVIQSSTAVPEVLEQHVEAWIEKFRVELEGMDPSLLAMEAMAVVSQLKERDTKLAQEVGGYWGEIVNAESYSNELREPAFDRIERIADELVLVDACKSKSIATTMNGNERMTPAMLKRRLLDFMDTYISRSTPSRRAMSARVYNQGAKDLFESNLEKPGILSGFQEIRHLKQFLFTTPLAPYWRGQQ